MEHRVLLITPPFTQLNTPYPATAYLKGFFNTQNIDSQQSDLGIEVILKLFSKKGLLDLFEFIDPSPIAISENAQLILNNKKKYLCTIDPVINFLQDQKPTISHLICSENYLPEASRFDQVGDLDWAFGQMGTRDKARHFATLYLEDISDLIIELVDPRFGFSRYAERLAISASSFDLLYDHLQLENSYIDHICLELLKTKILTYKPTLVAISIPFPGNVYSALKCGQWLKKNHPDIKICLGGGYANTELRSVTDVRLFEFVDFVSLDDGESPLLNLLEHLAEKRPKSLLKRTLCLQNGVVQYYNGSLHGDVKFASLGTPDYSGLPLKKYLSVIEIANPMHSLWSDGRWNKLTMAHGCYWGKCTFCDTSLDYIKNYEAAPAKIIVDRIEKLIEQTGENGFHFVDEAAPPALMGEVAIEIIRRELTVSWWTNIRFEKSFTKDLCQLLAASGCIAVSGGLEVASDRLLALIKKGVTVAQVAQVSHNFTSSGIMVHAYLMYGFPTQTALETINSLEIVRQLFELDLIKSGFWHLFAMTAHSPVGMQPSKFKVRKETEAIGSFANNDLVHIDPLGADHSTYSEGLKKSIFNYMHGQCFDFPLQEWFDFEIPTPTVAPSYIADVIDLNKIKVPKSSSKVLWLGDPPLFTKTNSIITLQLKYRKNSIDMELPILLGNWVLKLLDQTLLTHTQVLRVGDMIKDYQMAKLEYEDDFWSSELAVSLRNNGLIVI